MKNDLVNVVEEENKARNKKQLILWLSGLFAAAVLSILIFSCCFSNPARIFSISLLLGLACFITGSFLGLLFGIPKINKNHPKVKDARYELNSNLTDIADWLTKIIIGLGLVEFADIYKSLRNFSLAFARHVNCNDPCAGSLSVFAFSCIVFFFIFGIYFGYNYVRLFLSPLYADADNIIIDQDKINRYNDKPSTKLETLQLRMFSATESTELPFDKQRLDEVVNEAKSKLAKGQIINPDDPQKDQWGGQSERENCKLTAEVKEVKGNSSLFELKLRVQSGNTQQLRSKDVVLFNLHDSFNRPHKVAYVNDGVAELNLIAWGAFTVGAVIISSNTQLELDLATLPNAPKLFKER